MREIALHLLDIAENSVAAQAKTVKISVREDLPADRLLARVQDDGCGMDVDTASRAIDPFVTSRTTRKVGLGIPLLKFASEACDGSLSIHSAPGAGACLEVDFQHSHIDRMPLGDLAGTLLTLVIAYPSIHWVLDYVAILPSGEECSFSFDDEPVKKELDGIPLTEPDVLGFLREYLEGGVATVQRAVEENYLPMPTSLGNNRSREG